MRARPFPRELDIQILHRFFPEPGQVQQRERVKLLAMMGLYFLVLFAVGILRPLRNTFALDGQEESKFYQVYLVSAAVILFAPLFNHLADRIRWRVLIPATAAFFALNLVFFWSIYSPGSRVFGMVFYGWYDLLAAALVTQFFMAVQVFFNARDAKSAVPLVIAAGSLGATLGGFTTAILSVPLGAPNLLLLAALSIGGFAAALPFVWVGYPPIQTPGRAVKKEGFSFSTTDIGRLFANRQIRLIATLVLLTVVVKTVVDYEFNEAVAVYAGDRDAIAEFQGYVYAVINWLPIVILLPLGPLLKRWGVGLAILMLPTVMLLGTTALAVFFSVWVAAVVKGADATFRYSAERAGREILYVPVPTELKLKAKAYVDMAIEKGVGKGVAAIVILILLQFLDYRQVTWAAVGLTVAWIALALVARREYVRALSESIRGRFASFQASFASLTERSTLSFVEDALRSDPVHVAFALDLVEQAGRVDAEPLADEMDLLLDHESRDIRARVLRLLARFPGLVPEERIRERLSDPSRHVREAAVVALVAARPDADRERVLRELLHAPEAPVRHATLTVLARGEVECEERALIGRDYVEERLAAVEGGAEGSGPVPGETGAREELALALGLLDGDPRSRDLLERLLRDPEPRVARAALVSAGTQGYDGLHEIMVAALSDPDTREEARTALAGQGVEVVDLLEAWLKDPGRELAVRRQVPGVMARIPSQSTVSALLRVLHEAETERVVEFRALKALNKLRTRDDEELEFDSVAVLAVARRQVEQAERYAFLRSALDRIGAAGPGMELLGRSLDEAWEECQEAVFRSLGLVYPPDGIYRAYVTVTRGDQRSHANAVEWLEETVGHALFTRIEPVLRPPEERGTTTKPPGGFPTLNAVLKELGSGSNAWLALLARWNMSRLRGIDSDDGSEKRMDLIEKVFLLQKVDLLEEAKSSHLALLASIAEEVDVDEGEELVRQGETNESLYVVVRGSVELRGMGDQLLVARENTPFGTWALIDSDPSMLGARAAEPSRLLRITRSDFHDLLADHPELAMGMLQGLARRLRSLVT